MASRFGSFSLHVLLALASFGFIPPGMAMSYKVESSSKCNLDLRLSGEILQSDLLEFRRLSTHAEKKKRNECQGVYSVSIILNSLGGDVETALAIGRIIRGIDNTYAYVQNCASACVFLLAGAVDRFVVEGPTGFRGVGLHRFYLTDVGGSDLAKIRARREVIRSNISEFLREMDVSQRILDLSEGIPPAEIRWLTREEAKELRLHGLDAAYDERESAREASRIGLTVAEFRARSARAEAYCMPRFTSGQISDFSSCKRPIIYNISLDDLKRLEQSIMERCAEAAGMPPNENNSAAVDRWLTRLKDCQNKFALKAR